MGKWWYKNNVVCHWCGKRYESKKDRLQARFCSAKCKQAHHRAYKKYVTQNSRQKSSNINTSVTQKERKKRK